MRWSDPEIKERMRVGRLRQQAAEDKGFALLKGILPELQANMGSKWQVVLDWVEGRACLVCAREDLPAGIQCQLAYEDLSDGGAPYITTMLLARDPVPLLSAYAEGWLITARASRVWWEAIQAMQANQPGGDWTFKTVGPVWEMWRVLGCDESYTLTFRVPYIHNGRIEYVLTSGEPNSISGSLNVATWPELEPAETEQQTVAKMWFGRWKAILRGGALVNPRVERAAAYANLWDIRETTRIVIAPSEVKVLSIHVGENGQPRFNLRREGVEPITISIDPGDGQKPLSALLKQGLPVILDACERLMEATPALQRPDQDELAAIKSENESLKQELARLKDVVDDLESTVQHLRLDREYQGGIGS